MYTKYNLFDTRKIMLSKSKVEHMIHNLPENVDLENIMEELYLLYKIDKGLTQADKGDLVSHNDAKKRLGKWLD